MTETVSRKKKSLKDSPAVPRGGAYTRDALLSVALKRYQRYGYDATSLRAITHELGFTAAAMYYHFKSKDQLLVAAFRRNLEYLQMAHDNIADTLSSPERLWTFVNIHTRLQRLDETPGPQPYSAALLLHQIPKEDAETLKNIMRAILNRLRNII
jgi:AcrR family transcriptional regulator